MTVEILIATMYQESSDLILKSQAKGPIVIVNQTDFCKFPNIQINKPNIKFVSNEVRGLSKSRNYALSLASADICCISDSDCFYVDGYQEIISKSYEEYTDADVIIFDNIKDQDGVKTVRSLFSGRQKLNRLTVLKANSTRITFKRSSIISNEIKFNEDFGAGAVDFKSGEESIFLYDCLKNGLKIYYIPEPILIIKSGKSTWFEGFNRTYFNTVGAISLVLWGRCFGWFYLSQFIFRHRKIMRSSLSILTAYKYGVEGMNLYNKKHLK